MLAGAWPVSAPTWLAAARPFSPAQGRSSSLLSDASRGMHRAMATAACLPATKVRLAWHIAMSVSSGLFSSWDVFMNTLHMSMIPGRPEHEVERAHMPCEDLEDRQETTRHSLPKDQTEPLFVRSCEHNYEGNTSVNDHDKVLA